MAPRNNDPSTSYKRNYPVENNEVQDMVPCILHKKHKVVKLVKSQIRKIRQEGFICAVADIHPDERNEEEELGLRTLNESSSEEEVLQGESRDNRNDGRTENRQNSHNNNRNDARNDNRNDSRNDNRNDSRNDNRQNNRQARHSRQAHQPPEDGSNDYRGCRNLCPYILLFLAEFLLLLLLMVYISAGPLSNSIAHTPIPPGSFVRTERPCYLEKKYLLRWSRPEYLE